MKQLKITSVVLACFLALPLAWGSDSTAVPTPVVTSTGHSSYMLWQGGVYSNNLVTSPAEPFQIPVYTPSMCATGYTAQIYCAVEGTLMHVGSGGYCKMLSMNTSTDPGYETPNITFRLIETLGTYLVDARSTNPAHPDLLNLDCDHYLHSIYFNCFILCQT